jgi:hypothetical protein
MIGYGDMVTAALALVALIALRVRLAFALRVKTEVKARKSCRALALGWCSAMKPIVEGRVGRRGPAG